MKRVLLLMLPVIAVGCSAGPKIIRYNYSNYNETIHFNQNQQMLLNLVRLKYRETPLFLKVGALSTSYDIGASATGSANTLNTANTDADTFGLDLGMNYSARPTITYTPLEGLTYVKQVMSEVSPDTFALLFRSGWSMNTLCNVVVERIGRLYNNEDEPSYPQFLEFARTLREAQKRDRLHVLNKDGLLYWRLDTDRATPYDDRRDPDGEIMIPFTEFQLRSFLDIMFFLGKNTQVPEAHKDQVKESKPNGWINIRYSTSQPDDALVWVRRRGYFYSIASSDIDSKDTFAFLTLLFQIQAGDIVGTTPLLTLPVAGP